MIRFLSFAAVIVVFSFFTLKQSLPLYEINHVPLPDALNKQVCISGTKYMDGKLYFASERCPMILSMDPETKTINSIPIAVSQEFEMEGMTSYRNKLYMVSENAVAVYEADVSNGSVKKIETSIALPPKSKDGDGMEGIAANERDNKFYLLRERNDDMTRSQIYTFTIEPGGEDNSFSLKYESMMEMPLENRQWRYSDICYDKENDRLLCLKSFSKGKLRQQFLESIDIDKKGNLLAETLKNVPVEKFSDISNEYKDQGYSMNLEGITVDKDGNIFLVSDNTSGKAQCDMPSREKTILLELKKK
ncbi:MAG: esterase-like activity of phytase family protein [Sphingobacteriales bacterium]|nr:esterase-like activity of phytase family protein [Sphingobacteriales bacterium]